MKEERPVRKWIDEQLRADAELKGLVEERLNEMRIEQDLIALREKRGLSQKRLGELMGVSQPAIARMERGGGNLELRTLVRAAVVLRGKLDFSLRAASHAHPATLRSAARKAAYRKAK